MGDRRWNWLTRLWKSLTSTDNIEFARWRHSAPFWQHHNYISYFAMALTITFFSCRLFLYCLYNMWQLMHSVKISFLNSDCLLTSSLIQNTCNWWPHWYQNRWRPTVYGRWPAIFSVGFFYARRILHSASFLRLSVRPSVSRKVCPRRCAVCLRQLSFLL